MRRVWLKRIALVFALALLALSFLNASWLAPTPQGRPKLIAHRGAHQLFDHRGIDDQTCTATRIEPPLHDYLENTLGGLYTANRLGADMAEIDIAPTADGKIVLFHDWTLDCRTNGKGEVRSKTLAELKALDAGYGYTADGGQTFPFRGKSIGSIPALEQALDLNPPLSLLFHLKSRDAAEADQLAAALKSAGRDVVARGDGFMGDPALVARLTAQFPKAWAWSKDSARACTEAYVKWGWLGITPEACRNGTLVIPLDRQWAFAGWPNRLIARMEAVGARVVVVGPRDGPGGMGLDLPEQLGEVPSSFNGYIWVEDIWTIGPALRPVFNKRNAREEAELVKALEARRKRRE